MTSKILEKLPTIYQNYNKLKKSHKTKNVFVTKNAKLNCGERWNASDMIHFFLLVKRELYGIGGNKYKFT